MGFWPPCLISEPPKKTVLIALKNELVSPYVSTIHISVSFLIFSLELWQWTFKSKSRNEFTISSVLCVCRGIIKVTRFFVGRRFSSRGYIKSQESLYPLGTNVAVSGLVKDGPYGKSFTDPIIEVYDSTRCHVSLDPQKN